jgi:hypothetical protein
MNYIIIKKFSLLSPPSSHVYLSPLFLCLSPPIEQQTKDFSVSLVFGYGYLAGTTRPTWTTFSPRSSTFCLVLAGSSFSTPSTTTHVPARTSELRSAMAASTMTYRFPEHDPSLSSRNANASLSVFRLIFTHPPIRTQFPASPAPPLGRDTMDRIGTRSENSAFGTSEDETAFGISLKTHPCP